MRYIPLENSSLEIQIDDEDYERISKYKWYLLLPDGKVSGGPNRKTHIGRFILNVTDFEIQVDHKDRNKLNNQKHNLRQASDSQNKANKPKNKGKSKYKGVSFKKDRRVWRARLTVNCQEVYCETFDSELKAAQAYDKQAKKHFGEFAYLNFPK